MEIDKRTLARTGGIGLLAAVVLAAIVWGGWTLIRGKSEVDTALDQIRRVPLIGPVMAENSAVESRMRTAIEEELKSPTRTGLSRPFSLVAEIRGQYIVPSLRAADDASAMAAVAARAELVGYLRRTDPAACRQMALGALQRPDLLDTEGQRLFAQVLQTLEAAWRNGKKAGKPQPVLNREELLAVLQEAGFTKADFDRLAAFATLSNEVSCDVELKVDSLPPQLPADKRGPFARYILGN
ncbi:MAG: hypothetical protein J0J01_15745 [Reyranella sp.]|uniref:hypothetical protein n=1 Tax=Reyranella sp. TaxID=1929291 RepID=UPI001AC58D6B|nr:hypothetical protein [Reyranella sp.]MBN9088358.1 hypothetical protein [Reyranella sp.]